MKKKVSEKIKDQALDSDAYQASLAVHMRAFGPILAPAFAQDDVAKVRLVLALNHISNRNIDKGEAILAELKDACENNADHAAWHFFSGIAREMVGDGAGASVAYAKSTEYGHSFYLPYLKLAKKHHNDGAFATAEKWYLSAIACFPMDISEMDEQTRKIVASAYSNLASAQTMMHAYDRAEISLQKSMQVLPRMPSREAAFAMLYAAQGDVDKAHAEVESMSPYLSNIMLASMARQAEAEVEKILSGKHPQFAPQPIDEREIDGFWAWLSSEYHDLAQNQSHVASMRVESALKRVFPFMNNPMVKVFDITDGGEVSLMLYDRYVVALDAGYAVLVERMPSDLRFSVTVEVVHEDLVV